MTAVAARRDARSATWQFIAPGAAGELLALAEPEDCPFGAVAVAPGDLDRHVRDAGWPGVAAPDLGEVAAAGGSDAGTALARLARQVAPGGWLLFGVANAWYPHRPGSTRRLSLGRVRRAARRTGLQIESLYLALPDHRRPAVLAAAAPRTALDQVLYRMPTTYVAEGGRWAAARRRTRLIMTATANALPHRLRLRFAPGYVVVARRRA